MLKNYTRTALMVLPLMLAIAGCSKVSDTPTAPAAAVQVTATGLPHIDGDAHYDLWFSYAAGKRSAAAKPAHGDEAYVRIGSFRIDASGAMVGLDGNAPAFTIPDGINPQLLIDALVTVQQDGAAADEPGARLLAGSFVGTSSQGTAQLSLEGDDAFGDGLAEIADGHGLLDTPTSEDTTDFAQGVWLALVEPGGMHAGATLPKLPSVDENPDWHYTFWLTHRTGTKTEYIPLGSFLDPDTADGDGAGSGAGSQLDAAYKFAGDDFVAAGSTRMLNDGTYGVVVSLDPSTIPLQSPLLPLLRQDSIPATLHRLDPFSLAPLTGRPDVKVTVAR
jgi:hypothetical protein